MCCYNYLSGKPVETIVWDIKARLEEIFAFLNEISLRAQRKEDCKTYQSFSHLSSHRMCLFFKQIQ